MIRILKWAEFQHYKRRSPPWIKLHRRLLENRGWHALSGDASKLLAECWLLAADTNTGTIDMDAENLTWRLRRTDPVLVDKLLKELAHNGFVDYKAPRASNVLATRLQHATPETETEAEREKEKQPSVAKRKRAKKPATELPEGWTPKESHRTKAGASGLDLTYETEQFKNNHGSKGNLFADWDLAFHTWLGNAVKYAKNGNGRKPTIAAEPILTAGQMRALEARIHA